MKLTLSLGPARAVLRTTPSPASLKSSAAAWAACFVLAAGAILAAAVCCGPSLAADQDRDSTWTSGAFGGLAFRGIGPAIGSGRIGDFAVDPRDPAHWYVAVFGRRLGDAQRRHHLRRRSSTTRAATRSAASPSPPANPNIVWVGTGENNSQRSVAYGDGVYKSLDGGRTWKKMGLRGRMHIGEIIVHPHGRQRRLRGGDGPAVGPGRRPRRLPDHRRRRDLGPGAGHRREHRRGRPGDGPARSRGALRRQLPAAAPHLDADRRRPGQRASTRPPTAARPGARSPRACPRRPRPHRPGDRAEAPDTVYAIVEAAAGQGRLLPLARRRRELGAA